MCFVISIWHDTAHVSKKWHNKTWHKNFFSNNIFSKCFQKFFSEKLKKKSPKKFLQKKYMYAFCIFLCCVMLCLFCVVLCLLCHVDCIVYAMALPKTENSKSVGLFQTSSLYVTLLHNFNTWCICVQINRSSFFQVGGWF